MSLRLFFAACLLVFGVGPLMAAKPVPPSYVWEDVPAADRSALPPADDPTADGLTLLREVMISNTPNGTTTNHRFRMKVFTQPGVEALNKTEIPFLRETPPRDLAARIVKPDGRTIDVRPENIYTRDVVRVGRESISVKAFAFAGLEPGDIAEYRYSVWFDEVSEGARLYFDDPFPIETIRVMLATQGLTLEPRRTERGLVVASLRMQMVWSFETKFRQRPRDPHNSAYHIFEARDVRRRREEPLPPPDDDAKPWFLYYFTTSKNDANEYWAYAAGDINALAEKQLKPTAKLKSAAERIIGPSRLPRERVERLYDYCRTQIKNASYDVSGYTNDQLEKLPSNKSPTDTLAHGYGTKLHINLLFAALCRAAGIEACLAYCGDRSKTTFDKELRTRSALPDLLIALEEDGNWSFFDPGSLYLPARQLRWQNEGTSALVTRDKHWKFENTPRAKSAESAISRRAEFDLAEDGTLTGDITIEYTGHHAYAAKHRWDSFTAETFAEALHKEYSAQFGPIELSEITLKNVRDPALPLVVRCRVRVPDYAAVAGKRMIFQPGIFQKGAPERFPAPDRKLDVCFPFLSSEEDTVDIRLPAGFAVENVPAFSSIGDGVRFHAFPRFTLEDGGRRLHFRRSFSHELTTVAANRYAPLRRLFQEVHARDNLVITLQSTSDAAPAP